MCYMLNIYHSFISDVVKIGLRYNPASFTNLLGSVKKTILKDREMYMEYKGLKDGYLNLLLLMEISSIQDVNIETYLDIKESIKKIKEFEI